MLIRDGIRRLQPSRVVLYGSRARGDHSPTSDFDLAFEGVSMGTFGFWQLEVDWDFPCVWPFDVVSLDDVDPEFARVIRKEGLVVYDITGN